VRAPPLRGLGCPPRWACARSRATAQRHPKLFYAYVTFLHHVLRSHVDFLVTLPSAEFLSVLTALSNALDCLEAEVSSQAAFAIDHLASYFVRNARKDTATMAALRSHVSAGAIFESLMRVVFNVVVFGDIGNQWSLSRPLLSLIQAAELVRPGVRTQR